MLFEYIAGCDRYLARFKSLPEHPLSRLIVQILELQR